MPMMQYTIHDLNKRFSLDGIGDQDIDHFHEDLSLREVITEKLEIGRQYKGFGEFLDTAPDGIAQALQATLRSAISRGQPVTMAWKPGYDWEMNIIDVSAAKTRGAATPGGVTIIIQSRYPDDPSPVDSGAGKTKRKGKSKPKAKGKPRAKAKAKPKKK